MIPSGSQTYVFRLPPHQDLKKSILEFARVHNVHAGIILTCVGSLEQYHIRFANEKSGALKKGHFEIVSLTGTFNDRSCHLHISVSDNAGNTIGGHLLDENLVYTTAEIAVAHLTEFKFERLPDPTYGYAELSVTKM